MFFMIIASMFVSGISTSLSVAIFQPMFNSIGSNYYFWNYLLMMLSILMSALAFLIYVIPSLVFFTKDFVVNFYERYAWIIKEQRKPTTKRYLIRKILLWITFSTWIFSFLGNIILLIVELVYF